MPISSLSSTSNECGQGAIVRWSLKESSMDLTESRKNLVQSKPIDQNDDGRGMERIDVKDVKHHVDKFDIYWT